MIELFNTLGHHKQTFRPQDPERVTMYVCGPTVYSWPHVGNARPAVVFDVLYRLLCHFYPQVIYVRNITDVDDKINAAAEREQLDIDVISRRYIDSYQTDMRALGIATPTHEPRVTAHMEEIIAMVQRLVASEHAYVAAEHVLFSVDSFPEYGRLSSRRHADQRAGARVEVAPFKQNPADFVLWKPSTAEQPGWDSPWGRGRPGWHIECSTLAMLYLGETIDIHGGGQDLVFPHHENEIAQSVCAHGGRPFCNYWLHNGLLQQHKEKMSKSTGNIRLLRDELQRHDGETLRYAFIATHYRSPLDWDDQTLLMARRNLDRFYGALHGHSPVEVEQPAAVLAALADDLNTPLALTRLHDLASRLKRSTDPARQRHLAGELRQGGALLGLLQQDAEQRSAMPSTTDPERIQQLVADRDVARRARDFAAADQLRACLADMGIAVQDLPDGTSQWSRHSG